MKILAIYSLMVFILILSVKADVLDNNLAKGDIRCAAPCKSNSDCAENKYCNRCVMGRYVKTCAKDKYEDTNSE